MFRLMLLILSFFHMATLGRALDAGGGGGDDDDDEELPPPGNSNEAAAHWERVARRERKRAGNYRTRLRDAETKLKGTEGRVAPEGAVILTADEAKAWDAYKALGKPEEVTTKLGERDTLATKVAEAERDGLLRDAAQAAGYKFPVLKDRAGTLAIEIRDVTEGDKTTKRAFVKTEQGERPLTEYAEQHWGDYLPALKATQERQEQGGIAFPAQRTGDPPSTSNAGASFVQQKYAPRRQAGAQ